MEPDFWREGWAEGRTGFHQPDFNRHLVAHAERMVGGPQARVLVPLAGKTRDIRFLTDRGHEVVASELVESAVQGYFTEQGLDAERTEVDGRVVYRSERLDFHVGDFFALDADAVGRIDWIYDRAALVALPEPMRERYVPHLLSLLRPGGEALVVNFAYDQAQMSGPPFSVTDAEVERRFSGGELERLAHANIIERAAQFRERGLDAFFESVWHYRHPA